MLQHNKQYYPYKAWIQIWWFPSSHRVGYDFLVAPDTTSCPTRSSSSHLRHQPEKADLDESQVLMEERDVNKTL